MDCLISSIQLLLLVVVFISTPAVAGAGSKTDLMIGPSTSVPEGKDTTITCATTKEEIYFMTLSFGQRNGILKWGIGQSLKFVNNIESVKKNIGKRDEFHANFNKSQLSVKVRKDCFKKEGESCVYEHRLTVFFKAKPIFSGQVSCRVNNEANSETISNLNVTRVPAVHSVVVRPEEAASGENVTVTCSFDPGRPAREPKRESAAEGWTRKLLQSKQERRHVVSWWKIVLGRDGGAITCCFGSVCKEAKLSVRPAVYSVVVQPEVADAGKNVTVMCSFDPGHPAKQPKLDSSAEGWNRTAQSQQKGRHDISWRKIVQRRDEGDITCCFGSVCKKAKLSVRPVVYSVFLRPQVADAGEVVTVMCNFDPGNPTKEPKLESDDDGGGWKQMRLEKGLATWEKTVQRHDQGAITCCLGSACEDAKLSVRQSDTDWVLEKMPSTSEIYFPRNRSTVKLTCNIRFPGGIGEDLKLVHLTWYRISSKTKVKSIIHYSMHPDVNWDKNNGDVFVDFRHDDRIMTTLEVKWREERVTSSNQFECEFAACGKRKVGLFQVHYRKAPLTWDPSEGDTDWILEKRQKGTYLQKGRTLTDKLTCDILFPNGVYGGVRSIHVIWFYKSLYSSEKKLIYNSKADRVNQSSTILTDFNRRNRIITTAIIKWENIQAEGGKRKYGCVFVACGKKKSGIFKVQYASDRNATIEKPTLYAEPSFREKIVIPYLSNVHLKCNLKFPDGVTHEIRSIKVSWRRRPRNGFPIWKSLSDPYWSIPNGTWTTGYDSETNTRITTSLLVPWRDIPESELNYNYECEFESTYFHKSYKFNPTLYEEIA